MLISLKDILFLRGKRVKQQTVALYIPVIPSTERIPQSDKPISTFFVERNIVHTDCTVQKTVTFSAWLLAFVTKHPKYKYLYVTKSTYSSNRLHYWFLNTETNIKHIFSRDEIRYILKTGKIKHFHS